LPLNSFPGRFMALVGFLAALYAAYVSYGDMQLYGGADISGRIVGARVLMADENPYKFQWAPGKAKNSPTPSRDTLALPDRPIPRRYWHFMPSSATAPTANYVPPGGALNG